MCDLKGRCTHTPAPNVLMWNSENDTQDIIFAVAHFCFTRPSQVLIKIENFNFNQIYRLQEKQNQTEDEK